MLTHAWRSLRAAPRLTLTAILCAALGLGAAIFMTSLARAVLFAAPALPDADRLVRVWTSATNNRETSDISYSDARDLRERVRSFDRVESASRTRVAHTTDAGTERIRGESVTPGYFNLIGQRAAAGRLLTAEDHRPDSPRVVVISHSLWLRRYGGRQDVVGQSFRTRPAGRQAVESVRTIVGVMPEGFVGTVDPDVSEFWIPAAHYEPQTQLNDRMVRATWVLARLAPGASLSGAQAEIESLARELSAAHPAAFDRVTLVAEPFGESWRQRFRPSVLALLAAAGLLLLIACGNVAALLLARLTDREQELSVRLALGASRARLMQQLAAESLAIAAVGGVAGLAAAWFALRAFAASGMFSVPSYVPLGIDAPSAAAGVALVLVTAGLFAAGPARHVTRARADRALLSSGRRTSMSRAQRRQGRMLIAGQIALTFVLLAGAALLARTYQNLVRHDLGYRTDDLLRMAVTPDAAAFPDRASRLALVADIERTFNAYPGVVRASVMSGVLPPWFDDTVDVVAGAADPMRDIGRHAVGPGFFETMGIGLLQGRTFEPSDRSGGPGALISESLARRLRETTGRDPLGLRIRMVTPGMSASDDAEVVGIVNDVVYHGPLRPRPADYDVYLPIERVTPGALSIAIHSSVDPASLAAPLSRELGRLAPTSPQHWISTMKEELGLQFRDARLYAALALIYAGTAVALAVLGVYSVLAHSVARRRDEISVRVAVGATSADIVTLVMMEGARTIGAGLALGVGIAALSTRLLSGLLFGVPASDSGTYLVVALVIAAAAMCAVFVPAFACSRRH